ncbi:hypothetical protein ACH414_07220 [Streptomyces sp. NPDC020422]|uniref:hypothetical protein n=1 Tax=Streptomyces sp. NPDC020422 TaxID=3365074 RepID=UPI003792ED0B
MGNGPKKPEPKSTSLEGMSNEQLLAMLTPIQHARAEALAGKLKSAADEITKIAEYLRARATGGLSWKGVAAESFVEWTAATASATFYLANYTQLAGECLAESAQAMAQAKSGVEELAKTSASAKTDYTTAQRVLNAARHDPGAGKTEVKTATDDMNAAASAREKARIEALMKLRSLGQTYTFTGQRVNSAKVPEFPPPAGYLGDKWKQPESYIQVPGRSSRTSTSSTTGTQQTRQAIGGHTESTTDRAVVHSADGGRTESGGTARPTPTHVVPEVPADLGIDSVKTPPDTRTVPPTPTGPGPVKPEAPTYPGGLQTTPPPFITGPGGGPGQLPTGGGTVKGVTGGRPGPLGPGGTASARLPRETGIVGGRPVPPTAGGRSSTGIPRSTVIGNEQAYGRGGTGGAMGPHAGGPGGGGGNAAGRRLAMEQGGVVGGRAQKSGQAGARPFTPGGTGLVRGGQSGAGAGPVAGRGAGMHGASTRAGDDRPEERDGKRADYLVEDEETWERGKRPIVPPVVD